MAEIRGRLQKEDIFELIKFDLLVELMKEYKDELEWDASEFSRTLTFQAFLLNRLNVKSLLLGLVSASSKIGKAVIEWIEQTIKEYEEYEKEMSLDNYQLVDSFIRDFQKRTTSAYSDDIIAHIIADQISKLTNTKGSSSKETKRKTSVLIIDDLDRVDPEHVFRLFNVFSAHYSPEKEINKFGFDKVIFVCDIDNVRKMYAHRHGKETDFLGYIDKFYSTTPYYFSSKELIKEQLSDFYAEYTKGILGDSILNEESAFNSCLYFLIGLMIRYNLVNIRAADSYKKIGEAKCRDILMKTRSENFRDTFTFPLLIEFIKPFFSDMYELKNAFYHLSKNVDTQNLFQINYSDTAYLRSRIKLLIDCCIPYIVPDDFQTHLIASKPNQYTIKVPGEGEKVKIVLNPNPKNGRRYWEYNERISMNSGYPNIFNIFYFTIENCIKKGHI